MIHNIDIKTIRLFLCFFVIKLVCKVQCRIVYMWYSEWYGTIDLI